MAGLLAAATISVSAVSAQESVAPVATRPAIPFKTEPTPLEDHGPRVLIGLSVLLGLSLVVLYVLKKRLPNLRALATGSKRLQVVERVRLNPRCTLFVVRLDQREILIGQCGDTLVQLDPPKTDREKAS